MECKNNNFLYFYIKNIESIQHGEQIHMGICITNIDIKCNIVYNLAEYIIKNYYGRIRR
ncbi:hypothetical protein Cst_c16580 [Thermoclostridium stercorarium subsp. stercorarium DSM 8532]|uniref:Uncharacterized protein n=1 Tax=Thermoclostridium stercorarium (strain ATCC 35414 / DSM 8532 / NCIMB 11754) TaxID=1121335 RepID=L7VPF4_THES1|nr:hypothetical protein Cst_c16580 [Thermoclostridium stercorarium subsp. stercorarium DSM 8532]